MGRKRLLSGEGIGDTEAFKLRTENIMNRLERTSEQMQQDTDNLKIRLDKTVSEMNKKWGELANKMGTVVEDIVAPNIPEIARKYFGVEEFDDFSIRYKRKNRVTPSKVKEFDVIAVSEDLFIINETKATARETYIDEFVKMLNEEIYSYFPEHKEKRLIPIFSSLHIPENIKNRLTKEGIYAMGMGADTMDILNFDQIEKPERYEKQVRSV